MMVFFLTGEHHLTLRRLGGPRISPQIDFRFLEMIFKAINYNFVKKNS